MRFDIAVPLKVSNGFEERALLFPLGTTDLG